MKKCLGVLTGGGDCPGLNAVIRAITKTALVKGYEIIGFKDGFEGMIRNDFVSLDSEIVSGILTQGGTILGTSNSANPYRYPTAGSKKPLKFIDASKKVIVNYKKNRLSGLIVIGGDGTIAIANELYKDGLKIIGIPKTIDNDLYGTDVTFGFETAVVTASDAIDKIHTTAKSHHRVMVVEVMGRYAGWIALYSGVAAGGDIILIPEIPYHIKYINKKIIERRKKGKNSTIIVVAEGAKPVGGKLTVSRVVKKSTDQIRLGGIGIKIADEIEKVLGVEARATVLGHVQRGGIPTPFDRILATRFGTEAVNMFVSNDFGKMIVYRNNDISNVSLEEATKELKLVPKNHHLITSARLIGMSFGDK